MPCICDGVMTGDEYLDSIIESADFQIINMQLEAASDRIKNMHKTREVFDHVAKEAWIKAFRHHLFGCNNKETLGGPNMTLSGQRIST